MSKVGSLKRSTVNLAWRSSKSQKSSETQRFLAHVDVSWGETEKFQQMIALVQTLPEATQQILKEVVLNEQRTGDMS